MKRALYIPSKIYDNREDVPRDEDIEHMQEESWIFYTDLENKEYRTSTSGIDYKKYERIIETKAPIQFRTEDIIKIDSQALKVKEIQIIIPKDKEKACEMWPNMRIYHAIKRLYLK